MFSNKTMAHEGDETWKWPVHGIITDVFLSRGGTHDGVDIAAPQGTPVAAMKSGVVTRSYYSTSYGNVVFILHKNGFESVYAHLASRTVEKGEHVDQGETIGYVGSTGHSTGSHLHVEIHHGRWNVKKTNAVNPLDYLNESVLAAKPKRTKVTTNGNNLSRHPKYKLLAAKIKKIKSSAASSTLKQKIVVHVEKGDTLWEIGHEYEIPVFLLKKWNDLQSDLLRIGQKILIYPDAVTTYTIEEGDTLWEISVETGVSISQIQQLNPQLDEKPLYPGQILVIQKNSFEIK